MRKKCNDFKSIKDRISRFQILVLDPNLGKNQQNPILEAFILPITKRNLLFLVNEDESRHKEAKVEEAGPSEVFTTTTYISLKCQFYWTKLYGASDSTADWILCVQEVLTNLYSKLLYYYEMGNYFLDIPILYKMGNYFLDI